MFGHIMLIVCAAIWCACAAFALAALAGRARRAMRRCGVSARVVFLLAAAACVMLAGGKGGSVAVHDDYIADAGSYLTNDVAHVAIAKRTPNLPDSTEILVYARELSSTNAADWFRLSPHLTFAEHPYDYALPNATNYSVLVSSSFVPEPTVHTNGVWALRGFEIPGQAGRYAFGNSRTRIEAEYDAEVEYLESTGTQWIDTGKVLSSNGFAYDADLMFTSTANCQVFGGRTQANSASHDSIVLFVVGNAWRFDYFGNSKSGSVVKANTRYIVSYADGWTTVNGVALSTPVVASRQSGATIYIFAGHRPLETGGVEYKSSMKLYSLKFYQDGVLEADYQPVRVGNIGEMYDHVSGRFLERHGTFIVGPDKQ